jgi:hypothetical protein
MPAKSNTVNQEFAVYVSGMSQGRKVGLYAVLFAPDADAACAKVDRQIKKFPDNAPWSDMAGPVVAGRVEHIVADVAHLVFGGTRRALLREQRVPRIGGIALVPVKRTSTSLRTWHLIALASDDAPVDGAPVLWPGC